MSDAEPTTETVEAAPSPPAGDAPAAEDGPGDQANIPEAPSGDGPSVEEYVNDDSLDLESSGLPDKTVAEIKRLRKDVKTHRETAQVWSQATAGWTSHDMDQLREALALGPSNPQEIGQWFMEQGKALMGDTEPQQPQDAPVDDAGDELLTKDQVAQMVKDAVAEATQQTEEQKRIAAQVEKIKAETEALGFGPSHKLHGALLLTAQSNEISLEEAATLLKQGGATGDNDTSTADAPVEAGHTPVPSEGATPAGTQRSRDPKEAMRERLNKVLPDGQRGFAPL